MIPLHNRWPAWAEALASQCCPSPVANDNVSTVPLMIHLTPELLDFLNLMAKQHGVSRQKIIRNILSNLRDGKDVQI